MNKNRVFLFLATLLIAGSLTFTSDRLRDPLEEEVKRKKEARVLTTKERRALAEKYAIIGLGISVGSGLGAGVGAGAGVGLGTGAAGVGAGLLSGPALPIIIGVGAGVTWGVKVGIPAVTGALERWKQRRELAKKTKESEKLKKDKKGGGGGGGEDPDKDPKKDKDKKDKDKTPISDDRKYEPNPKHGLKQKGDISAKPQDGQKTLDDSIQVPDKNYRVGVEDGKFVQFPQHSPGKYHGFVVDNFNKLPQEARNALYKAGIVKDMQGRLG